MYLPNYWTTMRAPTKRRIIKTAELKKKDSSVISKKKVTTKTKKILCEKRSKCPRKLRNLATATITLRMRATGMAFIFKHELKINLGYF